MIGRAVETSPDVAREIVRRGHAGRVRPLDRFLHYAKGKEGVCFARKDEIARHAFGDPGGHARGAAQPRGPDRPPGPERLTGAGLDASAPTGKAVRR